MQLKSMVYTSDVERKQRVKLRGPIHSDHLISEMNEFDSKQEAVM